MLKSNKNVDCASDVLAERERYKQVKIVESPSCKFRLSKPLQMDPVFLPTSGLDSFLKLLILFTCIKHAHEHIKIHIDSLAA